MVVLETAATLFASHGLGSVSLRDIGASAGVPVSEIIVRFGSKDQIIRKTEQYLVELVKAGGSEARQMRPGIARDYEALQGILKHSIHHPGAVAFGMSQTSDPRLRAATLMAFDDYPQRVSPTRQLRLLGALSALGVVAGIANRESMTTGWERVLVEGCMEMIHGAHSRPKVRKNRHHDGTAL